MKIFYRVLMALWSHWSNISPISDTCCNLFEYNDDEIKGTVMVRVTMLLLKHVFEPDLADRLPNIFSLLKELSKKKTGLQYFESLVKYVFSNVYDITVDKMQAIVHNALLEDKGEYIVTLAEKLRKQGLEQGLFEARVMSFFSTNSRTKDSSTMNGLIW